ncbi:MAG: hypothetical protein EOO75_11425 [Myxococcales bacterium]|nr:MAG: hypothetical protein EOO75_11425 [Myxococcales bacterium]
MGYDTSFHPLPLDLVTERLIPYLLGEGDIDDLVAQAVHLRRVRSRAKAWALACQQVEPAPRRLDPWLHVWGRPFFLVIDDLDLMLDVHEQYLQASLEQVDQLALEQLHTLDPGLAHGVRARLQLPDDPGDQALRDDVLWRLDILRAAVAAVRQGVHHLEAGGRTHDPRQLLRREVPFAVLSLVASLSPGWMSRGTTWPSGLLAEVPLPTLPFFASPEPLLGSLPRAVPDQGFFLYPTIVENFMVGGLVAPSYLAPLRRYLAEHRAALLSLRPAAEQPDLGRELRKLDEALAFAQRRGWAFVEATDLYSGLQGLLN